MPGKNGAGTPRGAVSPVWVVAPRWGGRGTGRAKNKAKCSEQGDGVPEVQ